MVGKARDAPDPDHGTRARYNSDGKWKCRCDACKAAHAQYHRDYRRKAQNGRQLTLGLEDAAPRPGRRS
jgi:hypothetical protein